MYRNNPYTPPDFAAMALNTDSSDVNTIAKPISQADLPDVKSLKDAIASDLLSIAPSKLFSASIAMQVKLVACYSTDVDSVRWAYDTLAMRAAEEKSRDAKLLVDMTKEVASLEVQVCNLRSEGDVFRIRETEALDREQNLRKNLAETHGSLVASNREVDACRAQMVGLTSMLADLENSMATLNALYSEMNRRLPQWRSIVPFSPVGVEQPQTPDDPSLDQFVLWAGSGDDHE